MQRVRIQRFTTAGVTLGVMALSLAACSSSNSNPPSSGGSSSGGGSSLSGTLNASGSTFQLTFQQAAIQAYKAIEPNVTVNYGGGRPGQGGPGPASRGG